MTNYYRTILINLHRIVYYVTKARIWMRHPEKHPEEERYALAVQMVKDMNRSAGYNTIVQGTENLPKDGGYILYPITRANMMCPESLPAMKNPYHL